MGGAVRRRFSIAGGATGLVAQAGLLAAVVLLIAWLGHNASVHMAERGLTSGFDFLQRPAGFDVSQSLIPYSPADSFARLFVVGALNTLLVSLLGIATATVLGLIAGVARVSRNWLGRAVATAYVEVARNIPLPIQILVWYSALLVAPPPRQALSAFGVAFLSNRGLFLPKPVFNSAGQSVLLGIGVSLALGWAMAAGFRKLAEARGKAPSPLWGGALALAGIAVCLGATGNPAGIEIPRFQGFDFAGGLAIAPALTALWAALSFYTGGFIAEIVRGGLIAVSRGQGEAARALGLTPGQTLRLVVLPQAMRMMGPPLASQYLNLTKNSSLGLVVGYPDLVNVFVGTALNQTGQSIECMALVMGFYLAVSLSISALMNALNLRSDSWAAPA